MARKRYSNVLEMVRDLSSDQPFCQELEKTVAERQIVKSLLALRAVKGLSQADVAERIGVTQSRISKIENGVDADLRLRDLSAYARALEMDVEIVLRPHKRTIATEVKHHLERVKSLFKKIVDLAGDDRLIVRGVECFVQGTLTNLLLYVRDLMRELPEAENSSDGTLSVHIEGVEELGEADPPRSSLGPGELRHSSDPGGCPTVPLAK